MPLWASPPVIRSPPPAMAVPQAVRERRGKSKRAPCVIGVR